MEGDKTSFEQLLSVMPEGWEEKAKELGALVRGGEIKNARDLLRLVCLYLTEGKSLSGTAAWLDLAGMCSISKKAVFTRFQKSGEWLQWLCETIYRNNKTIGEAPEWLAGKTVDLGDASDDPVPGSDKADYRLHYAIGLFDLGMKEMALTGTEEGEKVSNFKSFGEGDIVIGKEGVPEKEWSLWGEQRLMLVLVKHILLETISIVDMLEHIHQIAGLCANSKRKRLPALYRLLVPK
jgi:hypothetical protein